MLRAPLFALLGPVATPWLVRVGALAVFVAASMVEPASVTEQHEVVRPAGWTGPPLRVALISDLHVGAPHCDAEMVRQVVAMANAARPDIALLLGDFGVDDVVGGQWVSPDAYAPLLAGLDAPLGAWAVLGNHDWGSGGAALHAALGRAGVRVLGERERAHRRPARGLLAHGGRGLEHGARAADRCGGRAAT